MNKQEQEKNIEKIIGLYNNIRTNLLSLKKGVTDSGKEMEFLDSFLDKLSLEKNNETRYAIFNRIVFLRESGIISYVESVGSDVDSCLEMAYVLVKDYYEQLGLDFISEIEKSGLASDFYLEIFKGTFGVGKAFNRFYPVWNSHINLVNKELQARLGGDRDKIMSFLRENGLLGIGGNGEEADRSYSVLRKEGDSYKSVSYFDAFTFEVNSIVKALDDFIDKIEPLEDEIYMMKEKYIAYLESIKRAFLGRDTSTLLDLWREVDSLWMKLETPFLIGHPLEYYGDLYRSSVAPEWGLKVENKSLMDNKSKSRLHNLFEDMYNEIGRDNYKSLYEFSLKMIETTKTFVSSEVLFFGSELCGKFLAQVVPNDESVSKKFGKRVISYPEEFLFDQRLAPKMLLSKTVFDSNILDSYFETISGDNKRFYELFDIEVLGHEYGHTLWLDVDTSCSLNGSGNFINVEEFKATSGAVISMIDSLQEDELRYGIVRHVFRSIGLMRARGVNNMLPYYCEGLIHLSLLTCSGIIKIEDKKIVLNYNKTTIKSLKKYYKSAYKELVDYYLEKKDPREFLLTYIDIEGSKFHTKDETLRKFIDYYHDLYKKVGNKVC